MPTDRRKLRDRFPFSGRRFERRGDVYASVDANGQLLLQPTCDPFALLDRIGGPDRDRLVLRTWSTPSGYQR